MARDFFLGVAKFSRRQTEGSGRKSFAINYRVTTQSISLKLKTLRNWTKRIKLADLDFLFFESLR